MEKFLWFAAASHTRDPDDTLVLFAFKLLGKTSGNAIFKQAQDIILALSSVGISFRKDIHVRITEVCKYGNLIVPPEVRAADPVSLRMIYYLFDKADETRSLTMVQSRALDIVLIAYATMSRLGEICRLRVVDVIGSTKGSDRMKIAIIQKQDKRLGLRTLKIVPSALGRHSWCPRSILGEWRDSAVEVGHNFVFSGEEDVPPTVQSVDKALVGVLAKLCPEYPLKITGHSARKGAALESCALAIPQALVQAQGGWRDAAMCSKYMASGWTRVASTFTAIERSTCSSDQTEKAQRV